MVPRFCFLDLRGHTPRPITSPTSPLCVALGNFDGVHGAHRRLLAEVGRMAAGTSALRSVFSFFSPSTNLLNGDGAKGEHLTTLREKVFLWKRAGIEMACLCDFRELRSLSPQSFLTFLKNEIGAVGAVCGENFRFGQYGAGSAEDLRAAFAPRASVIPTLLDENIPISSTRIRGLLRAGDAETARRLLVEPYALEATVVRGKQLGHVLGFPTANQHFPAEKLVPAHGVYATLCHTVYGIFPGVSNVGLRPTVEDSTCVNCETHIIGLNADLYGQRIRVEFLKHLRPEIQFDCVETLTEAIRKDTAQAAAYVAAFLA